MQSGTELLLYPLLLGSLSMISCGLILGDEAIKVVVALYLGAHLCQPHTCASGALVTPKVTHGLSCAFDFGRTANRTFINDFVHRNLIKVGFPAIEEPDGMLRSYGRKPATPIPWRAGRNLV